MTKPHYKRVVLETSLKPFRDLAPEAVRATCRRLVSNWERLAERADELCVLLWIGDGSEILLWRGDWDEPIVWAQSIGFCNLDRPGVYTEWNSHYLAQRAQPYMAEPPVIRFRDLQDIITALREAADEMLDRPLLVGATVDPGPEFVESDFKYERHPEVVPPDVRERNPWMMAFLSHQAVLHADPESYAGFPDGVPQGTGMGTFLGRQFAAAARDLGFDYLWLSNGLGYSHYPWGYLGELFDGQRFAAERAADERAKADGFWSDFRAECGLPLEVRGTNFSVGMDIASDGCSHASITAIGGLVRPPCNPPWGSRALGLEMTAYLSRIAKTATDRLPFRFYLNDPWFVANPWYDYYNRETFDIYAPMCAARLGDAGVDVPTDLSLLTIDTQEGGLLRDQAGEVVPHLLRALDERADAAGPVVWVYPFDEYHDVLDQRPEQLRHVFAHDWFVCRAVNAGLPLNTVCSTDTLVRRAESGSLPRAVYVAPVPVGDWAYGSCLLDVVAAGGRVLLYGSLDGAPAPLLEALGLDLADPLEGDFDVDLRLQTDALASETGRAAEDALAASVGAESSGDGEPAADSVRRLRHRAVVSGGGLHAVCDWDDPALRIVAERDGERRVCGIVRERDEWNGGRLAWVRGTVDIDPSKPTLEPRFDAPLEALCPAEWARSLLGELGFDIVQVRRDPTVRPANVFVKRHRGGWFFVGHKPNTTAAFWVRTDDGAPLYAECETPIVRGYAGECFGKSFYNEVRAFVQMADGVVQTKELPVPVGLSRRVSYAGLVDATVAVYPDPAAIERGSFELHASIIRDKPVPHTLDRERGSAVVEGFTGTLYAAW